MIALFAGFLLGLAGSFHCAGMCGPIAIALPVQGRNLIQRFVGTLLYLIGKALTYAILGAIFGLIGSGFRMGGLQRILSIVTGGGMIIYALFQLSNIPLHLKSPRWNILSGINRKISGLFALKTYGSLFTIGLLNGLLPCGLVYMALAGALAMDSIIGASLFMLLFGFGTLPILLSISLIGSTLNISLRRKFNKLVPYAIIVVGILFMLRGLSLGIPYLSPDKELLIKKTKDSGEVMYKTPDCCSKNKEDSNEQ